ncbi:hypothetical protein [Tessaracoccus defluvii]|uniref:Uncharacterized protein n=1 Tax=Tessaracoccus defluvii TaxID=1285901 RepID=A0A7H0H4B8_9ACTN|nr:hypothetical protein [Tessaracoccus defluvii]QNP55384.1 hypothetical protein H9L22_14390 [Tessaracoccus defluvii]
MPEPEPAPVPVPAPPTEEPFNGPPTEESVVVEAKASGPYETTFDASEQLTVEQLENLMLGEQAWDRLYRNDETFRLMP